MLIEPLVRFIVLVKFGLHVLTGAYWEKAAHSAYDMFYILSTCTLLLSIWVFPTSVFEVGISF